MYEKITGLIDAPFTPMHPDGSLNLSIIPDYAHMLHRNGLKGVFINGSSGEGYLLTDAERMVLAETWKKAIDDLPGFKLIVHVGSTSVMSAAQLASHASELGAWGIGTMAPPFPRIGRLEELVKYCEEISAAASGLPFYYYHIPAFNGADFSMYDFLVAAEKRIPNLAGIKFTHESLYEYNRCRRFGGGRFDMLHGQDETILASLALGGAQGCICGTTNYNALCLNDIQRAWQEGDLARARAQQEFAQDVIDVICRHRGNIVAGKHIMKYLGLDMGPNRTPFQTISPEEDILMKAELDAIDFFAHCNR